MEFDKVKCAHESDSDADDLEHSSTTIAFNYCFIVLSNAWTFYQALNSIPISANVKGGRVSALAVLKFTFLKNADTSFG